MFPSSNQLQGGSISVQRSAPLPLDTRPAPNIQLQPATNVMSYPAQARVAPPAPAPTYSAPSSGGGSANYGGGSGGSYGYAAAPPPPPPPPDPYAQWGGKGAYDSLVSGFNTQKDNIYGTSNEAARNSAIGLHESILDFLDSSRTGQRNVNERAIQNELGKNQGFSSISGMVGRGIRSGGVLLSNKNASDSSASEALARAYGDIGLRENNKINNQYEQENRQIGLAQDDINTQVASGQRKIGVSKDQSINSIALDARNKLASLDAAIAGANLPQRIAIEQEKNQVKAQVAGILGQYDNELNQGVAGIRPTGANERRATAAGLATAGVSATNPFDFSTAAPAQFQGTGPFASDLPLFAAPRKRTA
jgi:hypothetical protein